MSEIDPQNVVEVIVSDRELNNLECLGAFFTSQIHDLNNQVAILANSELLLEISDLSLGAEIQQFLDATFRSIHRLSRSCQQINAARRFFPVEVESVSLESAIQLFSQILESWPGWDIRLSPDCQGNGVVLNPNWLDFILQEIQQKLPDNGGTVTISVGEIPKRHYQYSMRNQSSAGKASALLVHFSGNRGTESTHWADESTIDRFQIALELVRLMGAGLSLGLSDNSEDFLFVFRLE